MLYFSHLKMVYVTYMISNVFKCEFTSHNRPSLLLSNVSGVDNMIKYEFTSHNRPSLLLGNVSGVDNTVMNERH